VIRVDQTHRSTNRGEDQALDLGVGFGVDRVHDAVFPSATITAGRIGETDIPRHCSPDHHAIDPDLATEGEGDVPDQPIARSFG